LPVTPKAVLLDVGGILIVPNHDRILAAFARGGFTPTIDLNRAHYAGAVQLTEERVRDVEWPLYWTSYLDAYITECGVPDELREEVHQHLDSEFALSELWMQVADGAHEGLRALQATGVRLGIISNADGTVEQMLQRLELVQLGPGPGVEVEVLLDSTVVGIAKPDPRIFDLALAEMGIEASDAWYVGDMPGFDVVGARAAGLRPFILDPFQHHLDADYDRIDSLVALAGLISS
jgi:putative hydrolase of the HAD superfamily